MIPPVSRKRIPQMASCTLYLMAFGGCPFAITEGSNPYPQVDAFPTQLLCLGQLVPGGSRGAQRLDPSACSLE